MSFEADASEPRRSVAAQLGQRSELLVVAPESVQEAFAKARECFQHGIDLDATASTPVQVRGADLRLAAAAARRLASGGLTHVWLVTPWTRRRQRGSSSGAGRMRCWTGRSPAVTRYGDVRRRDRADRLAADLVPGALPCCPHAQPARCAVTRRPP